MEPRASNSAVLERYLVTLDSLALGPLEARSTPSTPAPGDVRQGYDRHTNLPHRPLSKRVVGPTNQVLIVQTVPWPVSPSNGQI